MVAKVILRVLKVVPRQACQVVEVEMVIYMYDIIERPEIESSNIVIIDITSISHQLAYALFDLRSIYTYMPTYYAT